MEDISGRRYNLTDLCRDIVKKNYGEVNALDSDSIDILSAIPNLSAAEISFADSVQIPHSLLK